MAAYALNVLYLAALALVSPWLLWRAIRTGRYRAGWSQRFWGLAPRRTNDRPCLWLHAVSVGEVNLLAGLISRIERDRPEWQCVVSTTTLAGYELASKKYPRHEVFYSPLDFSWAVRTAVRRIRPTVLVLAELELWPNLVRAAKQGGARVAIVNGRLSEQSHRGYRRIRPLVRRVLERIDLVAAQNAEYAERFLDLGARPAAVRISGSMKYDGAATDRSNPKTRRLVQLAGLQPSNIVWLAGSTQDPEERLALEVYRELADAHPELRLILVPRHPERFAQTAQMLADSGLEWQRRSELEQRPANARARVLLVDTVGELGAWWGTAHVAFVGGSLGNRGGQNMIEPAAYGAAVCFGPNTRNFRDIVSALLTAQAAQVVGDQRELKDFVERCLTDSSFAGQLGRNAQALVASQLGATDRTCQWLFELVDKSESKRQCEVGESRQAAA